MVQTPLRSASSCALLLLGLLAIFSAGAAADVRKRDDVSARQAHAIPGWLREGVIYEIYPRQFSATGDFKGVTAQLERLQQLGVNIVWLMPIHPIGELKRKGTLGSPYSVRDYYGINREYGSAADFRQLIAQAHRLGMRVIIDIVANHTSWDSVLMKSPEFYVHDGSGHIIPPNPDWVDVADLDYSSARLQEYMLDMLQYWVREFDVDGFRCDYAVGLPTAFWERARDRLRTVKPDFLWLAESEDPALMTKAFDIDYSWGFYHVLTDVIQGREPASALRESWREVAAKYPRGALHMRFTDNHDESRAIARFGESAALAASALIFTLDGVPMIYNGMEVGDTTESGAPALFEKMPVYWQAAQRRPQFPAFYKDILALRKAQAPLTLGDVRWLPNSGEDRIVTFARQRGESSVLVAINLSSQPFIGTVDAGANSYTDITPHGKAVEADRTVVPLPQLTLAAWEYRVFRREP